MNHAPHLRPAARRFAWKQLAFPGEWELRQAIDDRPTLAEQIRPWSEPSHVWGAGLAGRMLGGITATPATCPALARVGGMVRQILQLEPELELSVFASGQWLVEMLPTRDDGALRVALSSAAVERLWVRETLFAVGRAIGGALLEHIPLLADPTVGNERRDQATLVPRGLWRFQELSRDRIGLVCCQDVAAAANSLVKAASGLPDDLLQLDLDGLLTDANVSDEQAMVSPYPRDFLSLRLRALRQFAHGELYQSAFAAGELDADDDGPRAGSGSFMSLSAQRADDIPPTNADDAEPSDEEHGDGTEFHLDEAPANTALEAALADAPAADSPINDEGELGNATDTLLAPVEPVEPAEPVAVIAPTSTAPRTAVIRPSPEADGIFEVCDGDGQFPSEQPESVAIRDPEVARGLFLAAAAAWVASASNGLSDRQRAALADMLGDEGANDLEAAWNAGDPDIDHAARCRPLGRAVVNTDAELREGLLENILHFASADGEIIPAVHEVLKMLTDMLGLEPTALSLLAAEYVDPEFADYAFEVGQAVEVHLDGEWVAGVITRIDASGDLRIAFPPDDELRLNRKADLIRPASPRRRVG